MRGRDITWWLWRTGLYDSTVDDLTPEQRKAKRSAPNPQQAGGRDIRLREVARRHGLIYVGRASGVSADGTELLVDGAGLPTVMAKVESFPLDRQQHVGTFLIEPSPPPRNSPAWLLERAEADLIDLPPMEVEPAIPPPRCETHPLRTVPLVARAVVPAPSPLRRSNSSFKTIIPFSPAVVAAEAAAAGSTMAASGVQPAPLAADAATPTSSCPIHSEPVGTIIFACGFRQNFERLIQLPIAFSDPESGYPLCTRGVSDVVDGLYFLGLPWLHKWKSVTLLGCAEDAVHVVNHILVKQVTDKVVLGLANCSHFSLRVSR